MQRRQRRPLRSVNSIEMQKRFGVSVGFRLFRCRAREIGERQHFVLPMVGRVVNFVVQNGFRVSAFKDERSAVNEIQMMNVVQILIQITGK